MSSKPTPSKEFEVEPFDRRQERYAACLEELKALGWGGNAFITDRATLSKLYSRDKSSHVPSTPAAAIRPSNIEQVAAAVALCAKHRMPMTPRGAGTGIEGGAIPYGGGLVIDTTNLRRLEVDVNNACAWVGAGVTKMELNKAVAKHGFLFGPDPSSNPCVGGMVSTSASGMCTLRYGTTRENVLALRVVTPQGNIVQTRQVVRKSSAGLELTQLYIGSEGTLGVVCEACFRLFPATKYSAGAVATFPSTEAAVKAVVAMQQAGTPATLLRCEMLNKEVVSCVNSFSGVNMPVMATVLMEFTTNDPKRRDARRDFNTVQHVFRANKADSARFLKEGAEMDGAWSARRGCYFAILHYDKSKGPQKAISTDVCVPLTQLARCVDETEKDFAAHSRPCFICAHISDGNFHALIPYSDAEDFKKAKELEVRLVIRAVEMGGTISGEHGIGVGKVQHVVREHGADHIDIQERIKKCLDPDNVMNPGCFYPFQQVLLPTAHL